MYFKISKKTFYSALTTASRAISNFSPLPAFSGIKIELTPDELKLTGSDSDISILTCVKSDEDSHLEIMDTGSVVIESKYILDIVRKIDSSMIEFEVIDGCLTKISAGSSEFKINGMKSIEYPPIDFSNPKTFFSLSSNSLKEMIAQTVFAASDKETRPVLTGVNFKASNKVLECVATDSYRLAKKCLELKEDINFDITIPAKSLNEISKLLEDEIDVDIYVSDKKVQFVIGDTLIQTRLIDGKYPETNRLIPLSFDYELTIDIHDILTAIDRASFIKNDGVSVIKLSLNENECILSNKSAEIGSSTEVLSTASYSGNPLNISFNGKYVFDAIRSLSGSLVKFSFCGEMKPFIIQSVNDNTILQLVLPVRTYA